VWWRKSAIDGVGAQWRGKPVAFVSYGGLSGGLRAVEALRVVFAELHTVTVRDTVSFHGAHQRFDAGGSPHDAVGPSAAASVLLDQMVWWGRALRALGRGCRTGVRWGSGSGRRVSGWPGAPRPAPLASSRGSVAG
jgi:hypothetical protein